MTGQPCRSLSLSLYYSHGTYYSCIRGWVPSHGQVGPSSHEGVKCLTSKLSIHVFSRIYLVVSMDESFGNIHRFHSFIEECSGESFSAPYCSCFWVPTVLIFFFWPFWAECAIVWMPMVVKLPQHALHTILSLSLSPKIYMYIYIYLCIDFIYICYTWKSLYPFCHNFRVHSTEKVHTHATSQFREG